jgi:DNA replication protein DnaC
VSEHTIPDIEPLLKRLSLANTRRTYRELIRRAEGESWTYGQFLQTVASEEIAHRRQTRINRLTHRAGFPFLKTIEEFDFSFQSTLRLNLLGSVLSPDFITDGRTLVLIGKPGRGKTHLAVATAYKHIQSGFEALFVTAAKMIDHLSGAAAQGRLTDVLSRYTHPALLVVDELGYLSYGNDAANMLFHVVNDRYLSGRSMIFTTNKKLTDWGSVLHDHDLAAAIVDRLLERGRIIALDGPSMRSQHLALDDEIDSMVPHQPDRISGKHRTDFPEPTNRTYEIPFSRKTTITEGCIKKWLALYRRYGKAGLLPKSTRRQGLQPRAAGTGAGRIPGVSHRSPRAHRTGGIPHPLRQRDDTDGNLIFITIPAGTIGGTGAGTTTHRKGA